MLLTFYILSLVIFVVAIVVAGRRVSELRETPATYNARMLSFAYFSLSSWILSALQFLILIASQIFSFPGGFLLDTGLWLGLMQNALWISAVSSLLSKEFSQVSKTLPLLKLFPIMVAWALLTYQIAVLDSEMFVYLDAVASAAIFMIFAHRISQWRLSRIAAWVFVIHGFSQSIWRTIWFTPWTRRQLVLLFAFPLGRIALLVIWIGLISAMLKRARSSHEAVVRDLATVALPNQLHTIQVMISSTVEDLAYERDAAERAILGLHFTSVGDDTTGCLPRRPQAVRNSLAKQCDIFILMIGERYGPIIKAAQKSVVEFEYEVAHRQKPEKTLVYVKDVVVREPQLEEFLRRLQASQHRDSISSFTTPEELYEKTQSDIARWLTSYMKQKQAAQVP